MSNFFQKIIKLASPSDNKGQAIDQYIIRGPEHEINPTNFNVNDIGDDSVNDFGRAYRYYWQFRKAGDKHSIAWDKAGCHNLPYEMQLQMREAVLKADPNFYHEAFSEVDFIKALMGKREIKEASSQLQVSTPHSINDQITRKREELINFGFDTTIVDRVVACAESKGFEIKFNPEGEEVVNIIRELSDAGLDITQYDTTSASAKLGKPKVNDLVTASSVKTRKVCLIGLPGEHRSSIAKRLASFYDVPHLDISGMLNQAIELGFYKDEEAEYLKQNIDKLKPKFLEVLFHMISDSLDGFVLEGYPVSKDHVSTMNVDSIVYLDDDMQGKVKTQKDKRWCPTCMYSYHLELHPPTKDNTRCDRCDSILTIRPEDLPNVVKDRYYSWKKQFVGMLKELRKLDRLIELDPSHSAEEAARTIERILNGKYEKTKYKDDSRPTQR